MNTVLETKGREDHQDRIEQLRDQGVPPYPDRFELTHPNIADIPQQPGQTLSTAGRLVLLRIMGGLMFATLQDVTGRIQIAVSIDGIGHDEFTRFKNTAQLGDFVGVAGPTFHTKSGEFTIRVTSLQFLGLALRPLPDKWKGVRDIEVCYRQRYLDLIANETSRTVFVARSLVVHSIRNFLVDHGFFEIETPVLNVSPSGALARPFKTHHNAMDLDLVLRIAPETYLKRACAGGFNRCFEFAKCFRNEGISPDHLQEFLMLEFYACYWNFRDNMAFTKALLQKCLQDAFGRLTFRVRSSVDDLGTDVDFSGDWHELTFRDAIMQTSNIDIYERSDFGSLAAACSSKGIELDAETVGACNYGRLVDSLYKKVARPALGGPVFLTGHPIETSPLARTSDQDSRLVDRFQLVVRGVELTNAYSELVDPVEQRRRLEKQASFRSLGDGEAMDLDEDFLRCMEHGMPPISGCGLGIDRLLKIVLGLPNIRDTVLFPLMRQVKRQENDEI
jgi:lysyl-tRNA synthetase, class II